tara:strand:- start:442 stop:960 length:519 start_codon:yes stop_codon:yes gene_type:complete
MLKPNDKNNEVFYLDKKIKLIDKKIVSKLIKYVDKKNKFKSRVCTHNNIKSKVHEMIIVHKKDYYVRPHAHKKNYESLFVLKGSADLVIFSKIGKVANIIPLSTSNSNKVFYYRIPKNVIHTLIIKSKLFIFHEVTEGPFDVRNTFFPKWTNLNYKSNYINFKKKIYNEKKL